MIKTIKEKIIWRRRMIKTIKEKLEEGISKFELTPYCDDTRYKIEETIRKILYNELDYNLDIKLDFSFNYDTCNLTISPKDQNTKLFFERITIQNDKIEIQENPNSPTD